jgi:hypothetical protein
MKKLLFCLIFSLCYNFFIAQSSQALSSNLVIGLPKASETELNLIKEDFRNVSRISFANFIVKDHVLIIEMDHKQTPYLLFSDIEEILLKYFQKSDIHEKVVDSFKTLKAEYTKDDKFIIK